jgi:TetR/AcrR family transcriptional regulator, regulator of cefoperazone and chloramphenicol sensitivity
MHLIKQFISELNPCAETTRGNLTREKLLEAGSKLFGQRGFDGVSARELAKQAGTPVSAMTYHFGTMEALYLAVIQQMVSEMGVRLTPETHSIQADLIGQRISPERAIERLTDLLVQEIVCCQDHPEWPLLMIREHLSPGPAYELIYQHVMLSTHLLLCELFALIRGLKPNDEAIELAAFAHIGQIIFFKMGAETIKRRMGWSVIDPSLKHKIAAPLTVAWKPHI